MEIISPFRVGDVNEWNHHFAPKASRGYIYFLSGRVDSGDEMDNCEVKYDELTRTVATKNVTVAALMALFNIQNNSTCWLRESHGPSRVKDVLYLFLDP